MSLVDHGFYASQKWAPAILNSNNIKGIEEYFFPIYSINTLTAVPVTYN